MMRYPAPNYAVPISAVKSGNTTIYIVLVVAIIVAIVVIGAIAIGLGVGLGLGLKKNSGSSSSTNNTLSAPTVTCTYGGPYTCGCASTTATFASARIINSVVATTNSWPWTVAIYLNNNSTFCGGFLISYQYVITAAHCIYGVTGTIFVYAGLQSLTTRASAQVQTVATATYHPNYSPTSYVNDIAVLQLSSSFTTNSNVGLCCLTSDTSLPSIGEHAVIVGWGQTSPTVASLSNNLRQAVVAIQNPSACQVSSTSNLRFCASYGTTTSCFGDSGSPLMTSVNNSWTCTGLTSAGTDCTTSTIYTRVSAYRSFISSLM